MLLLFLLLALNVKMLVKIGALLLFLLIARKAITDKKIIRQKFIWFYVCMIAIALLNLLIHRISITGSYPFVLATAILFWGLCIMAALTSSWFVERSSVFSLHHTLSFFFILNALFTIGQLALIIADAGAVNPYTYQGMYQKYFINTGDLMRGVTLDVSTTNAVLNSFAIVYFIEKNRFGLAFLCMAALLLTASNFIFLLLLLVFLILLIIRSTKAQKSVIVACIFLMVIFMAKISPQNNQYVNGIYKSVFGIRTVVPAIKKDNPDLREKPDSLLSFDDKRKKTALLYMDSVHLAFLKKTTPDTLINTQAGNFPVPSKPSLPKDNIHSEPFQRRKDTTAYQRELLSFASRVIHDSAALVKQTNKTPGKVVGLRQSLAFMKAHPSKWLTGAGAGNFSSKLAFRATGLKMAGGFPQKYVYLHNDFRDYHFTLYLSYFSSDMQYHSLINTPNSVYDQLITEYGWAGMICFVLLYLLFFVKRVRRLTYGLPLLILMLGVLAMDYWYEQLSVVILFELMMLINIKETGAGHE